MPISISQYLEMQRRLAPAARQPVPEDAVAAELPFHGELMKWCGDQWPKWPYMHADPSARSRITKGCTDFIIGIPTGFTLWLELKKAGGKLSDDQRDFHHLLRAVGIEPRVAFSMRDFMALPEVRAGLEWARKAKP